MILFVQESSRKFRCKHFRVYTCSGFGGPHLQPLPIFSIQCSKALGRQYILHNFGITFPWFSIFFNTAARPALFQTYSPPRIYKLGSLAHAQKSLSNLQKRVGTIRAGSPDVITAPWLRRPSVCTTWMSCVNFRDVLRLDKPFCIWP